MDPQKAQAYFPFVEQILFGDQNANIHNSSTEMQAALDEETPKLYNRAGDMVAVHNMEEPLDSTPRGSVFVMPFKEVIMKYDGMCSWGTETKAKMLLEADKDPGIVGHLLDPDSGGGAGDAVPYISDVINNLAKPVVTYAGNAISASATYGIISNSDEIYLSYPTDQLGSLGTYVTLRDFKTYLEKKHKMPVHEIYATKSTKKNKPFLDALQGDYESIKRDYLDPFNEAFLNMITTNRPQLLEGDEDVLKGKVYFADAAIDTGLADGFKSFNECIERVYELAEQKQTNKNSNNNMGLLSKTSFPKLNEWAKADEEARNEDLIGEVNAELKESNTGLFVVPVSEEIADHSALEATMTKASERIGELEAEVKTAQDAQAKAEADLKAANEALAKLQNSPEEGDEGGATTTVKTEKDEQPANEEKEKTPEEVLDSLPHNKVADEMFEHFESNETDNN